MNKYQMYLEKLELMKNNNYINFDQHELIKEILEKFQHDEHMLEQTYKLLIQRVKLGFRFDIAPETNHEQISLLIKDEKLSISNNVIEKDNELIIGENYDALKNLIVIERERERAAI
ncbi:type III restriction endonuclease subunit M [Mycoplasmopsis pulmonis]|uniref:type III restriction endonuclease subunit M n=1 Tax=Mycoplasmopsis pulmonis TaxID=2107 RepID=UPI0010051687|nr:type III restriction endonuclease subunit M [Mycoplasmopsis pulmonis]VEU68156.1 C-terminal truncated Type III restriction-modification system: methylase [Mycoplasmopsis pulmonis]